MAHHIESEDMAAICLILADGDLEINMLEVIERAEAYQEAQADHFGVTGGDFRSAMMWLALDSGLWTWNSIQSVQSQELDFAAHTLHQFLTPMLEQRAVYFNDEGEYWDRDDETPGARRLALAAFLTGLEAAGPRQVMAFLAGHSWRRQLLYCRNPF